MQANDVKEMQRKKIRRDALHAKIFLNPPTNELPALTIIDRMFIDV